MNRSSIKFQNGMKSMKERILERLDLLWENVNELMKFKEFDISDLSNKRLNWSLRYGFLESIQIIIDICCSIAIEYNLGSPKSYSDCIRILCEHEYFEEDFCKILISMVGLRNILVHEYTEVDMKILYSLLDHLDDFKRFIKYIREKLK